MPSGTNGSCFDNLGDLAATSAATPFGKKKRPPRAGAESQGNFTSWFL
jgi:hypothetical protein